MKNLGIFIVSCLLVGTPLQGADTNQKAKAAIHRFIASSSGKELAVFINKAGPERAAQRLQSIINTFGDEFFPEEKTDDSLNTNPEDIFGEALAKAKTIDLGHKKAFLLLLFWGMNGGPLEFSWPFKTDILVLIAESNLNAWVEELYNALCPELKEHLCERPLLEDGETSALLIGLPISGESATDLHRRDSACPTTLLEKVRTRRASAS